MKKRISEIKPQLARDVRATAKHFRLSPSEERAALLWAGRSVHRAATVYRAIVRSLRP